MVTTRSGLHWDAQLIEAFTSGRGEQMSVRGLLALPVEALRAEQSIGVLEKVWRLLSLLRITGSSTE